MYLIDRIIDENIKHLKGTYEAKRATSKHSAVLRDVQRGQLDKCRFHWQGLKRAIVEMIVPEGYQDEKGFHYGKQHDK